MLNILLKNKTLILFIIIFFVSFFIGYSACLGNEENYFPQCYDAAIILESNLYQLKMEIADSSKDTIKSDWFKIYEKSVESLVLLKIYDNNFIISYNGDISEDLKRLNNISLDIIKTSEITKEGQDFLHVFSKRINDLFESKDYFVVE
ncbi:MAG: hypothetical protein IJ283_07845 [Oscillospiraceae bacterium]|nr:hypothetical protein [Oscillospiraceae bacterium]